VILTYCPSAQYAAQLRAALPPATPAEFLEDWADFVARAPGADCLTVGSDRVSEEPGVPALAALREQCPAHPILVVTRRDAEEVRCLLRVPVDAVLWVDEVRTAFWAEVARVRSRRLLAYVSELFDRADGLPMTLRAAMVALMRSAQPVRTVDELARHVGCHRCTLAGAWRAAVGDASPLRIEDMLRWTLLHAVRRKRRGLKWDAVAAELGVHRRTLARASVQLAGVPLRGPDGTLRRVVLERFVANVLQLLHPTNRPTISVEFRHLVA
jgi:AraC-like DNA-binding protein